MLFAHRGYAVNAPQNSVAALKEAYLKGFRAVEFDIWFLNGELVLKHDRPTSLELNDLPRFRDYFLYKNQMQYWCDFKNLNLENAKEAVLLVKKIIEEEAINLNQIFFAPFITDYKLAEEIFKIIREVFGQEAQLIAVCERLESQDEALALKDFLVKNKVGRLSIFYKLLNKELVDFLGVEFFAWTVNDVVTLNELQKIQVKNFATDVMTPSVYVPEQSQVLLNL